MLTFEGVEIVQDAFRLSADIRVKASATIAVIGPSGAGKSTLLGAIAGFVPLHRGRICWQGQDLASLAPAQRPVSILFQDNNLFAHLDAYRNVALGVRPSLRLTRAEHLRVMDVLAQVGLDGLEHRRPAQLSGGQQSRVALARVMLRNRPLLLLDEPFAALGPALKSEMLDLVARICRETGSGFLMVTHDMRDARAIAADTILVANGQATGPFATRDLLDNPPPALHAYIGDQT